MTSRSRFPTFNPELDEILTLSKIGSWPEAKHRFSPESVWAIRAALATGRPLLLRGEAGIGKSQLARAAAHEMNVPFLSFVVNPRSEASDILYSYDAVSRLAQAQVVGTDRRIKNWKEQLAEIRFIRPGPMWWALDWKGARVQARRSQHSEGHHSEAKAKAEKDSISPCPEFGEPPCPSREAYHRGCVVLIDEIDKAEADFPNSLLETLGNHGFQIPMTGQVIRPPDGHPAPLVVVTTNEDRELPVAFLRRCLVLHMTLGKTPVERLNFLLQRGRDHFDESLVNDKLCARAAEQLLQDRAACKDHGPHRPGAAEFLDMLRMLATLPTLAEQEEALGKVAGLAFRKNAEPDTE